MEEEFWKQAFPLLGFFRTLCHKKPPERTQKPFSNRELLLSFYFLVKAWGYLNIRRRSLDYIGFFDGRSVCCCRLKPLLSQFPHPLNFLPFIITPKVIHTKPLRNLDIELKALYSVFLRLFRNSYVLRI